MVMDPTFLVPIIPNNLRKHETIIQIAEVLDHLSNVFDNLLEGINIRISENNKRLLDISQRLDHVDDKVSKLSRVKGATQVFSSSKYPADHVHRKYKSILANIKPTKLVRNKIKPKKSEIKNEPLEKLQIYHVNVERPSTHTRTGLGEVPQDTEYVSDILLYNTGNNIYKNFVISDVLNISQQVKEKDAVETSDIEPAPFSLSEKSSLLKANNQPYVYTPHLGDVPQLDVPLDLPDLPGIADDLRYDQELGPGIAPSVSSILPDLPLVEEALDSPVSSEINVPVPIPEVIFLHVREQDKAAVFSDLDKEETHKKIEARADVSARPPQTEVKLPAPPPPVAADEDTVEKVMPKDLQQSSHPTDAHASLMDSIRKAGGLKNAKLRAFDKDRQEEEKKATGGDLMADLHAKLSMRRKGISGAMKRDSNSNMDVSSAMGRLSALIPPPVPKNDLGESTNTEDDDWEE